MAESIDPFEAAMAAMDGGDGDKSESQDESNTDSVTESTDTPVDPFEAALSALDTQESDDSADIMASDDPFEAALQVAQSEHKVAEAQKPAANQGDKLDISFLMDIKLDVTFEVGRAKMFISDLLSLGQGSVIELHRLVGEELEIFVNGHLFAVGEVVVVNEKFGARITKIIRPEERIQRLGPHLIM